MNVQLKIHTKNGISEVINVVINNKQPIIVQHPRTEVFFELVDMETQLAPPKIKMKRVGNDLQIFVDDNEQVDIIIADYYINEPLSPIIGLFEDSLFYAYSAESLLVADSIPYLTDTVLATQVLNGATITTTNAPFSWSPILSLVGGVTLAGAIDLLLPSGGSADTTAKEQVLINIQPTKAEDGKLTGGLSIENDPNIKKYSIKFIPENIDKAIEIVYERQADNNLKLVTDLSKFKLPSNVDLSSVPTIIAANQPIVLAPDLLDDNMPVRVDAETYSGATGSTTATAPFDNNTALDLESSIGLDRDGNGTLDALIVNVKTAPNSKVKIVDKQNKVIAEGIADEKGNLKLPVALDPNNPNRNNVDDLNVISTAPQANPSDPLSVPNPTIVETPNNLPLSKPTISAGTLPDDQLPSSYDNTKDPMVDVKLNSADKDKINSVNLMITPPANGGQPAEPIIIKIEKDNNGNFVQPSAPNSPIKGIIPAPDGNGFSAVLDGNKVPKDSTINAVVNGKINNKDNTSEPSDPILVGDNAALEPIDLTDDTKLPQAKQPHIKTITAIDESIDADNNPETLLIEGNGVDKGDFVSLYVKQDGKEPVLLTTVKVTNDDGSFSISATDFGRTDIDFASGDKVFLVATGSGKRPSMPSSEKDIPTLEPNLFGHPYDSVPPVDPTIITKTAPGNGGAKVIADGIKPNEILTVAFTDEDENSQAGTAHKLSFALDSTGKLVQVDATTLQPINPQTLPTGITVSGTTITIDEKSLADNTTIAANIVDPAGHSSNTIKAQTGFDDPTIRNFGVELVAEDTSAIADMLPEKIKVKLKPQDSNPPKVGDIVEILDDAGNRLLKRPLIQDDFDANGNVNLSVDVRDDNKPPKSLSITLQEPNNDPSAPVVANVPTVADGEAGHIGDKQAPPKPDLTQEGDNIKVKFKPEETDTLLLKTDPTGKTITYIKDPDSKRFTPDDPTFPILNTGEDTLTIPRDNFPAGTTIIATAGDIAGHTSLPDTLPLDNNSDAGGSNDPSLNPKDPPAPVGKTKDPINLTITKVMDNGNPADGNPDAYEVTGEVPDAPAGTKVTIKDNQGNEHIGFTGTDKRFTITFTEDPNNDLTYNKQPEADKLIVIAQTEGKKPSEEVSVSLSGDVKMTFPNDKTPPTEPTVISNGIDGSVDIGLPIDAVPGDKVLVNVVPTGSVDDTPTTVTLTKNANGSWTSDHPELVPNANAGANSTTIPESAVKDGSTVSAKSQDLANNESRKMEAKAGSDRTTAAPVASVQAINLDSSANDNPEKAVISGNIPGEKAGVSVFLRDSNGNVIDETKTDDKGNFEFILVEKTVNAKDKPQGAKEVDSIESGDKYQITAKADDKAETPKPTAVMVPKVPLATDDGVTSEILKASHPNDKKVLGWKSETAPDTQDDAANIIKVENNSTTGKASAKVKLPTEADVAEFTVKFTNEENTEVEVTYKKQGNNWVLDGNAQGTAIDIKNGHMLIPDTSLKADGNGTNISVKAKDLAGNGTNYLTPVLAKDWQPVYLKVNSVKAIDVVTANKISDTDPEKLLVEVEAEEGAEISVTVNGKEVKYTMQASDSAATSQSAPTGAKKHTIELTETDGTPITLNSTDKVVVSASKTGYLTSKVDNNTVGTVANDSASHVGDDRVLGWTSSSDTNTQINPITVSNDPTTGKASAKVKLPTEADVAEFTIKFQHETDNTEVEVTYVKQNGQWKAQEDSKGTNLSAAGDAVEIPNSVLNGSANNGKISVKAKDLAGNETGSNANHYVQETAAQDWSATPSITPPTVSPVNLSSTGDNSAEKATISGTQANLAGATFTLYEADGKTKALDSKGQAITFKANDTGVYSLTLTTQTPTNGENQVASLKSSYKLIAHKDNHTNSPGVDISIGEVPRGNQATNHPNDNKPTYISSVNNDSAVSFKLPANESANTGTNTDIARKNDIIKFTNIGTTDNVKNNAIVELELTNPDATDATQAWTTKGTANDKVTVTKVTESDGKAYWVFSMKADNAKENAGVSGLKPNDKVKAEVTDYAGNPKSVEIVTPDPTHVDPVSSYSGIRKTTSDADVNNAGRLIVPTIEDEKINSGDIYIKPGADNIKILIDLISSTDDNNTNTYPAKRIWAVKENDGWKFVEDDNGQPSTTVINNIISTESLPTGKDSTNETYFKINADAVKDGSLVNVLSYDAEGNTTASTTTADFDDASYNTVTANPPTQSGNNDITIAPTEKDATSAVVEFTTAKDQLSNFKDLGLADPDDTKANKNYLIAVKEHINEPPGHTWKLYMYNGNETDDNLGIANALDKNYEEVDAKIASIDPTTGLITLNNDVVKNGSTVKAAFSDAFGNAANASLLNVSNTAPEEIVDVAPANIRDVGRGKLEITPGAIQTQPKAGETYKTVIDLDGTADSTELSIEYVPATAGTTGTPSKYRLVKTDSSEAQVGEQINNITIKEFNPATGSLILQGSKNTIGRVVTVTAQKEVNSKIHKQDVPSSAAFSAPDQDPNATVTDMADLTPLLTGAMKVTPGDDNHKVKLSYTKENGTPATLTIEKQQNGEWTATGEHSADFDPATMTLKNTAIKDGTHVTAIGVSKNPHGGEDGNTEVEIDATPKLENALVNDNENTPTDQRADSPHITPVFDPNNPLNVDYKIVRGGDNKEFTITYRPECGDGTTSTPQGGYPSKTLTAKLSDGGLWVLTDDTGNSVPTSVASINPGTGEVTLKGSAVESAYKHRDYIVATGTDNYGNTATDKYVPHMDDIRSSSSGNTYHFDQKEGTNSPKDKQKSLFTLKSTEDGTFTVKVNEQKVGTTHTTDLKVRGYVLSFKVVDTTDNSIKTVYLNPRASSNSDNISYNNNIAVFKTNGKAIVVDESGTETILEPKETPNEATDDLYFGMSDTNNNLGSATLTVKSGTRYKLVAESEQHEPLRKEEGEDGEVEVTSDVFNPKLEANIYHIEGDNAINSARASGARATLRGYLKNLPPEEEPEKFDFSVIPPPPPPPTPTEKPTLTANLDGTVTIDPDANHDRLKVTYVREDGTIAKAELVKQDNGWQFGSGNHAAKAEHFDFTGTAPKLKASAVKDKDDNLSDDQNKVVFVVGAKEGMLDSSEASSHAEKQPSNTSDIPERPSGSNTTLGKDFKDKATYIDTDLEYRYYDNYDPHTNYNWDGGGFKQLKDRLGDDVELFESIVENGSGKDYKFLVTLKEGKNYDIFVNGALGDMGSGSPYNNHQFRTVIKGAKGNDALVFRGDVGEDQPSIEDRRMGIHLGEGNNVLGVGTSLKDYALWYSSKATRTENRYRYFNDWHGEQGPTNAGYDIRYGFLEGLRLVERYGGRLHRTDITMGNGDDLVFVEGIRRGNFFAVEYVNMDLGGGHDTFIMPPNGNDSGKHWARGMIGGKSVINMGEGNDYLNSVGIADGTVVNMGNGDDVVDFVRIANSSTRLNMGDGDDLVTVRGEVRDGAEINLGNGNDVFAFGDDKSYVIWGSWESASLFQGKLDGGSGYDIVKLYKPQTSSLVSANLTNLDTQNFKNIEEIWLDDQTSVDIKYNDLLNDGVNEPIKIRKMPGSNVGSSGKAVVDLGASNTNNDTIQNLEDTTSGRDWVHKGTTKEANITYNIYVYNNDYSNAIWIENGITVI